MRDTAKQILNYWYSLECLQSKEVPKYKAIPKKYIKELIFKSKNDTITIYQQSVIKPYWKRTNSRVSTYVVPLPNDPYNYSIIDEIKYFKDEKDYVLDDEHAVLLGVVKGTKVLEAFIDKLKIEVRDKYMKRMNKGIASAESGIFVMDLLSNLERVSDHFRNIAETVERLKRPVIVTE